MPLNLTSKVFLNIDTRWAGPINASASFSWLYSYDFVLLFQKSIEIKEYEGW